MAASGYAGFIVLAHQHKDTEEKMFTKRNLAGFVILCAVGIGIWWAQRPQPEPEPETKLEEGDTGFSRQEVEDRMRAIGYVQ